MANAKKNAYGTKRSKDIDLALLDSPRIHKYEFLSNGGDHHARLVRRPMNSKTSSKIFRVSSLSHAGSYSYGAGDVANFLRSQDGPVVP